MVLVFLVINYSLNPDGPLSGEDRMRGSGSNSILIGAGQDQGERVSYLIPSGRKQAAILTTRWTVLDIRGLQKSVTS